MRVRVPDYFDGFSCLAGACPHTCCEKWKVVVDEETARRYQETPGSLGERLYDAKIYLMTADLLAWTVVIVALSAGFEKLVLWLLRRILRQIGGVPT